jgi:hypothetical protein
MNWSESTSAGNKASHVRFPTVPAGEGGGSGYISIGTDEGDDSEDYDWSAEEDLVDEAAKFESKMGISSQTQWSFKRSESRYGPVETG